VSAKVADNRLYWRVVVRTEGRLDPSRSVGPMEWHLAQCTDAANAAAHCGVGQALMANGTDPDGHCLVDGACPRCGVA
jgi:hypothetical protein